MERDLNQRKFGMVVTNSARTARELLELQNIGVVLCGFDLGQDSGIEFLELLNNDWPAIQGILLCSASDLPTMSELTTTYNTLNMPWTGHELSEQISQAFQRYELLRENIELRKLIRSQVQQLETKDLASRELLTIYNQAVTEERELEMKLHQSEKLASLGLFVGGVAHEVNSPLASIKLLTESLRHELVDNDDALEVLHDIEVSADRCRRIIASLRSFVHGSAKLHKISIQVDEIVEEVVRIFIRDYGTTAQINCEFCENLTPIRGDVALLHQLFRNLLQNAYHSLPKSEGLIQIKIREGSKDDEMNNSFVTATIEDNGSGISKQNLKHLFEPFFTTKGENKLGSGLGLSICYQIVTKHRGKISVESEVGEGTRFTIELPVGEATGKFRLADLENARV